MASDYGDEELEEELTRLAFQPEDTLEVEADAVEPASLAIALDCIDEQLHALSREGVLALEAERLAVGKSPYDRFRAGRGHVSVTDLVSPAWCEAQFQYSLELGGRKRRTRAMRIGHRKHAELERQVHEVVHVVLDHHIPEEVMALRLLNILRALIELQKRGITRECPVFGFVDDLLVYGIVDELQYITRDGVRPTELDRYLGTSQQRSIVISDAKTRVRFSQPSTTQSAQSKHQVMLYLRLLRGLCSIDLDRVLSRYSYDRYRLLSDAFIAQALNLDSSQDAQDLSSINALWLTLQPLLQWLTGNLSDECRVLYIHQESDKVITQVVFKYDEEWSSLRTNKSLAWWHGERTAEGVPIEEAGFKCSLCEMVIGCTWRITKAQEAYELAIKRRRARVTRGETTQAHDLEIA